MPRKTDFKVPADWLWIAVVFDLDDPDWPRLRAQVGQVTALLQMVKSRLPA